MGYIQTRSCALPQRRLGNTVLPSTISLKPASTIAEICKLGIITTDETRLRQVVINMLSNAGKFTSKGAVILGVKRAAGGGADTVVISVKDTGIGISRANIEKLFTDFSQAEVSTATKYGGTGLGLALCRGLCRLMRGEISVESEVGRGSTFTVRLPVDVRPGLGAPPGSNALTA